MTEHIKCSEENAYSVAGHNFDKENFVESNNSGPSDHFYMIPLIGIIIVGLAVDYLKCLRDTKYLLSTGLRDLVPYEQEYFYNDYMQYYMQYYMQELPNNQYHMQELPNNQYLYLRTDQMQSDFKSLGLIITDLPACITKLADNSRESMWDASYASSSGNSIMNHIRYHSSDLTVSKEFELLIKNTVSPGDLRNQFNLAEVYTHFCYIYAAIYNHYVIRGSEDRYAAIYNHYVIRGSEDREEDVKHLQNILNSIEKVEDHLKVADNKEIILRIELVKTLDRKLLAFIKQVLSQFYSVHGDDFAIELYCAP